MPGSRRARCCSTPRFAPSTPKGRTNFSLLKTSIGAREPLVFLAFDLLEHDGKDIARLPQIERKLRLAEVISEQPANSSLQYSSHVEGHGQQVFEAMCKGGFEGVVAKSPLARYYSGERSPMWLKVKCIQRQGFVVIGWRPPDYGEDVRGLFLATYENDELLYRGGVGTGFTDRMRRETLATLRTIEGAPLQVKGMPKAEARVARWVKPLLLAEVAYTEITPDGLLRHPSFKGLREDKPATDAVLEVPASRKA